jgi:hypothetical protein
VPGRSSVRLSVCQFICLSVCRSIRLSAGDSRHASIAPAPTISTGHVCLSALLPGVNHAQFAGGDCGSSDLQPDVDLREASAAIADAAGAFLEAHRCAEAHIREQACDALESAVLRSAALISPYTTASGVCRLLGLLGRVCLGFQGCMGLSGFPGRKGSVRVSWSSRVYLGFLPINRLARWRRQCTLADPSVRSDMSCSQDSGPPEERVQGSGFATQDVVVVAALPEERRRHGDCLPSGSDRTEAALGLPAIQIDRTSCTVSHKPLDPAPLARVLDCLCAVHTTPKRRPPGELGLQVALGL